MDYVFKHTTSYPYHPKGNERAEAAVKVAESMLKKADDFHTALCPGLSIRAVNRSTCYG